jgi:hypothetical protein
MRKNRKSRRPIKYRKIFVRMFFKKLLLKTSCYVKALTQHLVKFQICFRYFLWFHIFWSEFVMQMKQKWGKPQSTKFCEKEKARLARPFIMWAPKAKTKKKYEEEMFEAGITTQAFKMNRSHMILSLIII